MKKFIIVLLALLGVVTIYYFTSGSEQLTLKMKEQVDAKLSSIQTKGFGVKKKEISEKKEHLILSFDEPAKISTFLHTQGIQITPEDIQLLKGMQIGVDIDYLPDTYSAVSFDIYPMTLPTALHSTIVDAKDKKILQELQKILQKKTFLLHVDINKLGTAFKGYMKDINETIQAKYPIAIYMNAFDFKGELEENRLTSIQQRLKRLSIKDKSNTINIQIDTLESNYKLTGKTTYDYSANYHIKKIHIAVENDIVVTINDMQLDSQSKVVNNQAFMDAAMKLKSIDFKENQKHSSLEQLKLKMKAENFDIKAMQKLETINPDNEKVLFATLQELISKGIRFEIPNFSAQSIVFKNQKLDGFTFSSRFDIDKNLNLITVEQNPLSAINAINADIHLALSEQLFGFIAAQPQAMMVMMLFQPKSINKQKVYKIQLKDGRLTVNNMPVM